MMGAVDGANRPRPIFMTQKIIHHIGDLIPDPMNARTHNPYNIGQVVSSLHAVGAARSIVIDEHGVVLAGNGVVEAAAEAGITRVEVVDADGETIIAVRRTGLTQEQKTKLALYDNVAGESSTWNPDVLRTMGESMDLAPIFGEAELARILATARTQEDDEREASVPTGYQLLVTCHTEVERTRLLRQLTDEGIECRAV